MKTLKVYGGLRFNKAGKQERVICAVNSQREVAKLTGESLYYIRDYWAITGNDEEIKQALANPHQLIWAGKL